MSELQDRDEDFLDDEEASQESWRPCCRAFLACMECWDQSEFLIKVKKVLTFLVTNLGLICLVTCYCLFGAVIFELIEFNNEIQVKRSIGQLRNQVMDEIWSEMNQVDVFDEDKWTTYANGKLRDFERKLLNSMRNKGWNGYENEDKIQWTFAGSLFYSINCITTIGYGDLTTKTQLGKIVTILYSVIGIPLFFVCMSNTGSALANSFRFVYWKCHQKWTIHGSQLPPINAPSGSSGYYRASHQHSTVILQPRPTVPSIHAAKSTGYQSGSGTPKSLPIKQFGNPQLTRTIASHHRRALSVRSKASFEGRATKKRMNRAKSVELDSEKIIRLDITKPEEEIVTKVTAFVETNVDDDNISNESRDDYHFQRSESDRRSKISDKSPKSSLHLPLDLTNKASTSGDSSQSTPTKQFQISRVINSFEEPLEIQATMTSNHDQEPHFQVKKTVPLKVCFCIILGYVMIGAYVFHKSEGWAYLNAAYFCVITLTTIGFGDFVPETNEEALEQHIVLTSLYLLCGISLIFMTFEMVQEQVRTFLKKVAFRLGLIKDL